MNDREQSSYGKDLVLAIVTTVGVFAVIAVIYLIFRAAGLVGLNWG